MIQDVLTFIKQPDYDYSDSTMRRWLQHNGEKLAALVGDCRYVHGGVGRANPSYWRNLND